jgi:hypothetical protein
MPVKLTDKKQKYFQPDYSMFQEIRHHSYLTDRSRIRTELLSPVGLLRNIKTPAARRKETDEEN